MKRKFPSDSIDDRPNLSTREYADILSDYLISDLTQLVLEYLSIEGRLIEKWEMEGSRISSTNSPEMIMVSPDGEEIFVTDQASKQIQVFSPEGRPLRQWRIYSWRVYNCYYPEGMALDPRRKLIYLVDAVGHLILIYSLTGELIGRWGEYGLEEGKFYFPRSLALGQGKIYVIDSMHRVQAFILEDDPSKIRFQWQWRKLDPDGKSPPTGTISLSGGIAVSPLQQEVYLADERSHCIHVLSSEGKYLRRHELSEFFYPYGIAYYHKQIYVTNRKGDCIWVYSRQGEYIREIRLWMNNDSFALHDDKIYTVGNPEYQVRVFQQVYT